MLLDKIKGPKDIKKISINKLPTLAKEVRMALLNRVSKMGGHVGPNFGAVEATIAMHYVFDCPKDKIIYDVSHQSYPHKILTGRANGFLFEEDFSKVSGYTNPNESKCDMFTIGHTSTSISLAIGVAKARDLKKEKYNVIAFIGDGSLSGGEALEGLNAAHELNSNLIVVLNDNNMCMAENHGGLYSALKTLRDSNGKSPNNIFKSMEYNYIYVDDGNDINELIKAFKKVKNINKPTVVHICTTKGKGLKFAEANKEPWHFQMPFDPKTGKSLIKTEETYPTILRDFVLAKAKKDRKFTVITSATPGAIALNPTVRQKLGNQYIDVGIAEQTAAAVASGCAANGGKPLWNIASSFIQRAYDQLSQDIGINNSPVAITVLLSGVYGLRDVTHLGIFDIPLISNIPNLVYVAPTTKEELLSAVEYAIDQNKHPMIVKVPSGPIVSSNKKCIFNFDKLNKYLVAQKGKKVAFIGLGCMYWMAKDAADLFYRQTKIKPTVINPMFITGIDEELLHSLKKNHDLVITIEDGILDGGFGEKIARFYGPSNVKVLNYGMKKQFLDRYDLDKVLKQNHLDPKLIVSDIKNTLKNK